MRTASMLASTVRLLAVWTARGGVKSSDAVGSTAIAMAIPEQGSTVSVRLHGSLHRWSGDFGTVAIDPDELAKAPGLSPLVPVSRHCLDSQLLSGDRSMLTPGMPLVVTTARNAHNAWFAKHVTVSSLPKNATDTDPSTPSALPPTAIPKAIPEQGTTASVQQGNAAAPKAIPKQGSTTGAPPQQPYDRSVQVRRVKEVLLRVLSFDFRHALVREVDGKGEHERQVRVKTLPKLAVVGSVLRASVVESDEGRTRGPRISEMSLVTTGARAMPLPAQGIPGALLRWLPDSGTGEVRCSLTGRSYTVSRSCLAPDFIPSPTASPQRAQPVRFDIVPEPVTDGRPDAFQMRLCNVRAMGMSRLTNPLFRTFVELIQGEAPLIASRIRGKTVQWNGRFGFFRPLERSAEVDKDVFVHACDAADSRIRVVGTEVQFDVTEDSIESGKRSTRQLKAINVTVIDEKAALPSATEASSDGSSGSAENNALTTQKDNSRAIVGSVPKRVVGIVQYRLVDSCGITILDENSDSSFSKKRPYVCCATQYPLGTRVSFELVATSPPTGDNPNIQKKPFRLAAKNVEVLEQPAAAPVLLNQCGTFCSPTSPAFCGTVLCLGADKLFMHPSNLVPESVRAAGLGDISALSPGMPVRFDVWEDSIHIDRCEARNVYVDGTLVSQRDFEGVLVPCKTSTSSTSGLLNLRLEPSATNDGLTEPLLLPVHQHEPLMVPGVLCRCLLMRRSNESGPLSYRATHVRPVLIDDGSSIVATEEVMLRQDGGNTKVRVFPPLLSPTRTTLEIDAEGFIAMWNPRIRFGYAVSATGGVTHLSYNAVRSPSPGNKHVKIMSTPLCYCDAFSQATRSLVSYDDGRSGDPWAKLTATHVFSQSTIPAAFVVARGQHVTGSHWVVPSKGTPLPRKIPVRVHKPEDSWHQKKTVDASQGYAILRNPLNGTLYALPE